MPRVIYIEPDGRAVELQVADGDSVMSAAMNAGLEGIEAQCGGNLVCATCHCYVQAPWLALLPAPSADERLMLQNVAAPLRDTSRLSCQLIVRAQLDGLTVQFPERQS